MGAILRVLVVGTSPSAIELGAERLAGAGHEVFRCHDPGAGPFPCLVLQGRACPLESPAVDVVVTARNRAWPRPSRTEDGAVCALRRRVPLVVTGTTVLQPFDRWSTKTAHDRVDIVAACEQAAAMPLAAHSQVARDEARALLAAAGRDPDAGCRVFRRHGALRGELTLPADCADLTSMVVTRVLSALRRFDPFAAAIDIAINEAAASGSSTGPAPSKHDSRTGLVSSP